MACSEHQQQPANSKAAIIAAGSSWRRYQRQRKLAIGEWAKMKASARRSLAAVAEENGGNMWRKLGI
jgi:hypothetical protein